MSTPDYPVQAQARYNVLSIVAIIGAFVVPLIGAIVGFIALRQIGSTGERGRGLALAAVVLGLAFTVVYILVVALSIVSASVNVSTY